MGSSLQIVGVVSGLLLILGGVDAFEFKVGGPGSSWAVPSDSNAAIYNHWAEKSRFQIGDTLLFVYDGRHDSVLHVTQEDYNKCNTASALDKFSDGHTVFELSESGPYYFISGVADNCRNNEKLVVVVMADRSTPASQNAAAHVSTAAALSFLGFSLVLAI